MAPVSLRCTRTCSETARTSYPESQSLRDHRKTSRQSAVPQPSSRRWWPQPRHNQQAERRARRGSYPARTLLRSAQHHAGGLFSSGQARCGGWMVPSISQGWQGRRRNSGKRVKIGGERGSRGRKRTAVFAGAPLLESSPVPPIGSTRVRRPAFGDTRGRSSTQFPAAGDRSGSMGGHERAVSAGSGHRQSFLAMPPKNRFP